MNKKPVHKYNALIELEGRTQLRSVYAGNRREASTKLREQLNMERLPKGTILLLVPKYAQPQPA